MNGKAGQLASGGTCCTLPASAPRANSKSLDCKDRSLRARSSSLGMTELISPSIFRMIAFLAYRAAPATDTRLYGQRIPAACKLFRARHHQRRSQQPTTRRSCHVIASLGHWRKLKMSAAIRMYFRDEIWFLRTNRKSKLAMGAPVGSCAKPQTAAALTGFLAATQVHAPRGAALKIIAEANRSIFTPSTPPSSS